MRGKIPWNRPSPVTYTAPILELELYPMRSALVILDMQEGYLNPEIGVGPFLRTNYPEIHRYYYDRLNQIVMPNILRLRDFFRGRNLQIFYTRMGILLPGARDLDSWSWRRALLGLRQNYLFEHGRPEHQLVASLTPLPDELVLDKNTFSPFASTALDGYLHNMAVENLVICGVLTDVAIETTAREASDVGYNTIVVEDACAEYRPEDHDSLGDPDWWVAKTTEEILLDFSLLLQSS